MDNCKLTLLIMKNTAKLEKMIESGADYSVILKQSKKLDTLIMQKVKIQIHNRNCS